MKRRKHHLKRKWKITLIIITAYLIVGLCGPETISITLHGDNPNVTEYGEPYKDPGAEAAVAPLLLPFLHKSISLNRKDNINIHQCGTYEVAYTAKNTRETRTVLVKDTRPPAIDLVSNPDHYTLPGHPYEEEGFTAIDNHDGDITRKVKRKEENGIVYYSVRDSSGNEATLSRKIIYDDRMPPLITLDGGNDVIWFTDEGPYTGSYTASDDLDGDLTDKVKVEGTVDENTPGDYQLKYTVADSYQNTSEAVRTVHVVNRPVNPAGFVENAKTIYLTFDDGPGPCTDQLLDILSRYNVKASFFTTSAYPGYAYDLAREAAEGHTVALHTYSHNYASVYASPDSYWNDFSAQNEVIHSQTGSYTTLFRFPGGSSNTVSKDYCEGIMTELTGEAVQKGYTWFDWNVSSGDAGGTTDTDTVYNNVINGISRCSSAGFPSVVLQHDVKDFSVNAVEQIILWGLENGYNFQPLHTDSYTAHHGISN